MKKIIIKTFDKIIVVLLIVFAGIFSGCKSDDDRNNYGANKYGMPPAKYKVIENETNTEDVETIELKENK